MTESEQTITCEHEPNYQKGCIICNVRYVKLLRPSRQKQDAYLANLPEHERKPTLSILEGVKK